MSETPVLALSNVSKKVDSFQLGPIDLSLEPGYVYALVGPNGAGKSTLFRIIMNLLQPDQGNVQLFGYSDPDKETTIKQRIGYIPERPIGIETYTGEQLASYMARGYPTWNNERYQTLIQRLNVDEKKKVAKLSKGTERKLLFTLAMAHEPDLLLMDEPTAGLDLFAQQAFLEEVTHLMEDGSRTVFLATHQMNEIRRIADFIILFSQGKVLGIYEKDTLLDHWKTLWIERTELPRSIPGMIHIGEGNPLALVTKNVKETVPYLKRLGIPILKIHSMELDNILAHLLSKDTLDR